MVWPLHRRKDVSIRPAQSPGPERRAADHVTTVAGSRLRTQERTSGRAPDPHACPLPRVLELHEVGMWQCASCGLTWQLVAVAADAMAPPVLRWAADPFTPFDQ